MTKITVGTATCGSSAGAAAASATPPVLAEVRIEQPLPEVLQTASWLKQVRRQHRQVVRDLAGANARLEKLRRDIRALRARLPASEELRGQAGAPSGPARHQRQARVLARLATAEQAFVQCQAARAQLAEQAQTLTKREAALWYNWGVEADGQRRLPEAMSRYRQALALNAQHLDAHYNLATDLLRRRRLRQAQEEYYEVVALDPNDADAHYNLGLIAEQYDQRPQEALQHYHAYLETAPSDAPERRIVQGWVNVLEGQRKEGGVE